VLPRHGVHHQRILVLSLLSPSLGYDLGKLPVATRVRPAEQLLVALKGLHDIGLVHRCTPHPQSSSWISSSVPDQILIQSADFNEGALMWEMASISEHDTASRYKWFCQPKKMLQYETFWKRGKVVQPITIPWTYLETDFT
jgi:hypothetical protein